MRIGIDDFGNPPTKDQGYVIQAVANLGSILEIVGEYYHDRAVERARDRADYTWAVLRPEPDNKHDPHAVGVYIKNSRVGYLSREDAALVQKSLLLFQGNGKRVACPAEFSGDYDPDEVSQIELHVSIDSLIIPEKTSLPYGTIFKGLGIVLALVVLLMVVYFVFTVIWALLTGGYKMVESVISEILDFFRLLF